QTTPVGPTPPATSLGVDPGPLVVGGRLRDGFDQPDIVVVDVHQAGDDAAVFGALFRIGVLVSAGPDLDSLPASHVLEADGCDDRLQLVLVVMVVVVLHPVGFTARHEVPAIEV